MKRASESASELQYREFFEHTPLGLWDEDYTELMAALEALKAAGVRDFAAYFAAHPEVVLELAYKVQIYDVNQASLAVFGARSKEELIGGLDKIFVENSLPVFRDQLIAVANGSREFAAETHVGTLDGRSIYVYFTIILFPQPSGKVRALVSTLDITERRRMEIALRESEEQYADLYDNAPDMFASLDPKTGSIVQCNQTMATSLGYTKGSLVGRTVLDVVHPGSAEEFARLLGRLSETETDTVACRHLVLVPRSGGGIDTSLKISVVRSEHGRVMWYNAVWRDIGEQRIAEQELASKEQLYRTLTESIPHMIWLGDAQGRITYCNQTMSEVTGIALEEMRGRDWSEVVHPGDRNEVWALQEVARWSGIQYRGECRIQGADPGERIVHYIITPVRDGEGKVLQWVGINTDITGLKRVQAELQRSLERSNRELAQIAHAASHDLQEPLRMVTSYVQLLAQRYEGKLDAKADKYIGYAVQGAKRIRRLIRDLLTFSEIGMDGAPAQPVDCARAIQQAERSLEQDIDESGAEIDCQPPMPFIMGHPAQMALLFRCLLSNSIKFRGEEPPRITISARRDGLMWLFTVQDNGIGFDNVYGERIFQMFQRLHPRGVYPGTGIGLALAKKIVESHGGRIWADSVPAQGTAVYFTLPTANAELVKDA